MRPIELSYNQSSLFQLSLKFFKKLHRLLDLRVLVVRYSYRTHSIIFWQNFSNITKYLKKLHFLPISGAYTGFTLQTTFRNLYQNAILLGKFHICFVVEKLLGNFILFRTQSMGNSCKNEHSRSFIRQKLAAVALFKNF